MMVVSPSSPMRGSAPSNKPRPATLHSIPSPRPAAFTGTLLVQAVSLAMPLLYRHAVLALLLAAAALIWGGPAGCKSDIRERDVQTIPIVEARRITTPTTRGTQAGAILMDARPASAFAAGHLPGAINVRIDSVKSDGPRNQTWSAAPAIIVYGDDGASAAARALARRLMEAGYRNVRVLEGGFAGWTQTGLPVE